ncbi:MAG: ATP-binding cassette domain-containing protein [Microthrixaceae bacterium]|nr:ATP-binding cassette domain-containing protein [Microthrixaceae bacterium]
MHYGGLPALSEVDLTVRAGERVALLGPSGAGKSTLLRLLCGLVRPSAGEVWVGGDRIDGASPRRLRRARSRLGVVFQSGDLPGSLRVVHNVEAGLLGTWSLPRALASLLRSRPGPRVEEVLDSVGLAGLARQRTDALSGGQRQRVAVARVLLRSPPLILADEPVSSVDPELARVMLGALVAAGGDETTTIVSLHNPELARRYCDRAIGIGEGRVRFDRPVAELTDADLDRLYGAAPAGDEAGLRR